MSTVSTLVGTIMFDADVAGRYGSCRGGSGVGRGGVGGGYFEGDGVDGLVGGVRGGAV